MVEGYSVCWELEFEADSDVIQCNIFVSKQTFLNFTTERDNCLKCVGLLRCSATFSAVLKQILTSKASHML